MSSQKFTPVDVVDMNKERDWAASLGLLDWDKTSIVFTKRSLIEFLKYTGITVDTNNTNISKLPHYAKFGKLESLSPEDSVATEAVPVVEKNEESTSIPSAIAEVLTDSQGHAEVQEGTGETSQSETKGIRPSRRVRTLPGGKDSLTDWWSSEPTEEFKPTRRVRQTPGGQDNLAGIL